MLTYPCDSKISCYERKQLSFSEISIHLFFCICCLAIKPIIKLSEMYWFFFFYDLVQTLVANCGQMYKCAYAALLKVIHVIKTSCLCGFSVYIKLFGDLTSGKNMISLVCKICVHLQTHTWMYHVYMHECIMLTSFCYKLLSVKHFLLHAALVGLSFH